MILSEAKKSKPTKCEATEGRRARRRVISNRVRDPKPFELYLNIDRETLSFLFFLIERKVTLSLFES